MISIDVMHVSDGWEGYQRAVLDSPVMSRWTDGEAVLPLAPMRAPAMLLVHLAGAMTFLEEAVPGNETERRAA
jgi:hypothetical protein